MDTDFERELIDTIDSLENRVSSLEEEINELKDEKDNLDMELKETLYILEDKREKVEELSSALLEESNLTNTLGLVVDFYQTKSNRKPYKY